MESAAASFTTPPDPHYNILNLTEEARQLDLQGTWQENYSAVLRKCLPPKEVETMINLLENLEDKQTFQSSLRQNLVFAALNEEQYRLYRATRQKEDTEKQERLAAQKLAMQEARRAWGRKGGLSKKRRRKRY